jgi:hypothetical protein
VAERYFPPGYYPPGFFPTGYFPDEADGGDDSTPNAFSFTDQAGAPLASLVESNEITISGIDTAAAISITNGTFSVEGAAYTNEAGFVTNGSRIRVRGLSSAANNTAVNVVLTVGGVSDTFTITTVAAQSPITSAAGRKRDARKRGWARIWLTRG